MMVEETKLVEATQDGEEVKVEILSKVTLVLLMAVVVVIETIRRWRWVRTSDLWAATSAKGRSSWLEVLSWGLERSVLFFFYFRQMLLRMCQHLFRTYASSKLCLHLHFDQVGLLAAVGVTEVQVAVAPSVAVLSTGGMSFH